jgi:guanylate kinase
VHYRFVEPEDFAKLVAEDELLEWAEYNGKQYGTLRAPVVDSLEGGRDVLLEIEVQGARQIRARHPDAIMFFVVPPSLEDLGNRLRLRADTSEEDIVRRLRIARDEIAEARGIFNHVVINDDLERCIKEVDELMSAVN